MQTEDQSETIAFLQAHAAALGPVTRHETHISQVILAGQSAFKLKRALRLPYLDFSTAPIRLKLCEAELKLNRRTAPALYRRVLRVTRAANGGLEFGGPGALVDAVLEMARFEEGARLDRLATADGLSTAVLDALTDEIVAFHRKAPVVAGRSGAALMRRVLEINLAGFASSRLFARAEVAALDAALRARLARFGGLFTRRAASGWVRHCHGDLHLQNIALVDGRPLPFDCIEFSTELAEIDVLYDLAFLLMDLWARGLRAAANRVLNRYLDALGGEAGMAALPLLMAMRAAIRAHVGATRAETAPPDQARAARAEARRYFGLAMALVAPAPARVVALGGFSGSGKSTLAQCLAPDLAPPPGARIIESDVTRKALFGVAMHTKLPPPAYAPDVSAQVYARMAARAGALAASGVPVVVGAVFAEPAQRRSISHAARKAGAEFCGAWLTASPDTLRARLATRAPGASDATAAVLEAQLAAGHDIGGWPTLAVQGGLAQTCEALRAAINDAQGQRHDRRGAPPNGAMG